MLEWSKRALAMKKMGNIVQSAGTQPLGTRSVGLGPKGTKNNPWDWWESDGEGVNAGDFAYERPEETQSSLLEGSRGDKWRAMDLWRQQQQEERNGAVVIAPQADTSKPEPRYATGGGSLSVKSFADPRAGTVPTPPASAVLPKAYKDQGKSFGDDALVAQAKAEMMERTAKDRLKQWAADPNSPSVWQRRG